MRAAIEARPDYAEAHYTLGTVLKQQGKFQEAADALREAIRLQPDFAGAHTTLAGVLRQLGNTEGAAAESKLGTEMAKSANALQAAIVSTNTERPLQTTVRRRAHTDNAKARELLWRTLVIVHAY